ncbi:MAG: DUF2800 domain-containing protein [Acidobacteria bacterium]|nr:DUF2800 domain-containing protein [Acidobacteriota bacterium]
MQTINTIRLVISQPNVRNAPSEWDFKNDAAVEAAQTRCLAAGLEALGLIGKPIDTISEYLTPVKSNASIAVRRPNVPKLEKVVAEAVGMDFDSTPDTAETHYPEDKARLAKLFLLLPLIEKWSKAVSQKTIAGALAGEIGEAEGLKVVEGRAGNRAWDNPAEVEEEMKAMRIKRDQMYHLQSRFPDAGRKADRRSQSAQVEETGRPNHSRRWYADRCCPGRYAPGD